MQRPRKISLRENQKLSMNSDLKDIFKLIAVLSLLIVIGWLVVFFSNHDAEKKQLLFPPYALSSWKSVTAQEINYSLDGTGNYSIDENQWSKIQTDLSRIYVLEVLTEPNQSLIQEFAKETPTFSINLSQGKLSYYLGAVNKDTGNFWLKIITSKNNQSIYYLCRSEIYFDGFYQTDLEGNRLSYYRFENYFIQPFKSWYGKNFWISAKSFSLRTERNILFSINIEEKSFWPVPPPEVEIKKEFMQGYVALVDRWIPTSVEVLTKEKLNELSQKHDFILEFKLTDQSLLKLSIIDTDENSGLLWKEQGLFFPAPKEFLNQLVILPENFYLEKIVSIEKIWKQLQSNSNASFQWVNLKTHKESTIKFAMIEKNKSWKNFFCFMTACLDMTQAPLMKINQVIPLAQKQWSEQADFQLIFNHESYYFSHSPYKLQVLTPQGYEFSFINREKEIYPTE